MNEHFKEIEDRAQELAWEEWKQLPESNNGDKMDIHHLTRFKRKFAELIVRECADHIDDLVTCDDDGNQMLDCDDVRTELLEHFGVIE